MKILFALTITASIFLTCAAGAHTAGVFSAKYKANQQRRLLIQSGRIAGTFSPIAPRPAR